VQSGKAREDIHKCMWKSNFGSVDSSIAGRLEDGKEGCKVRIEDDLIDDILSSHVSSENSRRARESALSQNPSLGIRSRPR
jgi:hypothetical protein